MMAFDNAAARRDWWFLSACAALFFCGIITMYSLGLAKGQPWAYKQLVFGVVALVLFVAAAEVPLQIWRRRALLLVIFAVVLLVAVWLFGAERKGAQRWLVVGGLSLQPVEFFKFAALLIGANFCARAAHTRLGWDLAQPLLLALLIPLAFLLHQPDAGSFLLIVTVSIAMLFLAGLRMRWFAGGLLSLLAVFGALIAAKPYILQRLVSFGNPLDDRYGSDYNVALSLMSFARGGFGGAGGGNLLAGQNLPEAHNDFIIAAIAEERGLIGFVIVAALLLFVIMRAAAIGLRAAKSGEMFGAFYAFGFAALAAMQVVINISGSLALLPVKGLTLPLVSYGGSSLTATALMIAVLMRVDVETRESGK
ncbi:MAG: FtsW/RodA/SpoVE family cell cycle protein [Gammaproteobacteria bacterium]